MRDIPWRTRRFAMHTDPSVVLCMLSPALRSLPLVSDKVYFNVGYFKMLLGFTRTMYNT